MKLNDLISKAKAVIANQNEQLIIPIKPWYQQWTIAESAVTTNFNVNANINPYSWTTDFTDVPMNHRDIPAIYANAIFHAPNDTAREICSEMPEYALKYAKYVDKGSHIVTYNGVKDDKDWKKQYIDLFGKMK